MRTICSSYIGLACLAAAVFIVTGCDSSTGSVSQSDVTFEGRVTDESGFGKSLADIEGAVVTASNVTASGSTNQLAGEATTNASGQFTLDVEGASEEIVLVAEKTGFQSKVMVYNSGGSRIEAMPMTVETAAEADVYIEAREQDDDTDEVTMSDVAVYVTETVGADVRSGSRSSADIATAIRADVEARRSYVREEEEDEDAVDDARAKEREAFLQLQSDLSASASADAEAAAIESFEGALIDAYTEAGVALETQAQARQAGLAAIAKFGSADLEMRKKAEILAGMATAQAVEASFEAGGASSTRLNALAQARSELIAELRSAASADAIADAKASYQSAVQAELASELEVQDSILLTARQQIDTTAKTALEATLTTAASAEAVAAAHSTFYVAAETSAEASLSGSTGEAAMAASVLALLSLS